MINKFIFLLQESLISIVRTKVPSVVASLAIAVSLVVLSVAYCLFISFENLTLKFKDRYSVEVFFLEEIKENDAIKEEKKVYQHKDYIIVWLTLREKKLMALIEHR